MSQVPAATRTLQVLRFLASQPDPVPLERLAAALDLPRSTAYHLVNAMIEQGFVTHIAEERRYCLGVAAFEVGIGYARQAPLQRIAHRPLAALVDRIGQSAHLAVPHGRDVLYVLEERAPGPGAAGHRCRRTPAGAPDRERPGDHGRAAGRARCGRSTPTSGSFVDRHGRGPQSLSALRSVLSETRRRGYAAEDGEVTPGFASVAVAVLDHNGTPAGRDRHHLRRPARRSTSPRSSRRCPPLHAPSAAGWAGTRSVSAVTTLDASTISTARRWSMLGASVAAQAGASVAINGPAFLIPSLQRPAACRWPRPGRVAAMPIAGVMVTLFVWGLVVDRIGERTVLLVGLGGTAVLGAVGHDGRRRP